MSLTINFPINQIAYTSFTEVGFHLFTSGCVPLQIKHIFLKQIVYRYWKAEEHKSLSFRAIYLLQVAPEQWLFGWLYNDMLDNVGQSYIPYFICYYLAEPLYAFRIEKVFAYLQKGPVELIDPHSISVSLKPLMLKDLSLYEEARPGVLISWEIRQQIYKALKEGKLIDIFIPLNQQQKAVAPHQLLQSQKLLVNNERTDDSLRPIIPLNQQQKAVVPHQLVQSQKLVVNDQSSDNHSLLIDKKLIFLIGMGLGTTTMIIVTVFIYVFFHTNSLLPNQPTQLPSQNTWH